jgi:hypothetical protein
MLRNLAISTLLCAGVVSVAYADVFRWVDDHGGVHYSDQWVPGSEVIKSSTKSQSHPTGTGTQPSYAPKVSSTPSTAAPDNSAKAVKQDVAKIREQQCKEAKDRYDKAIQARRIYKPGPTSGTSKDADHPDDRQYLSEEDADAYRVKARQDMQDYCGNSGTKPSGE